MVYVPLLPKIFCLCFPVQISHVPLFRLRSMVHVIFCVFQVPLFSLSDCAFVFWIGFLADKFESYEPAFYFAGAALLVCSLLPFLLFCTKANRPLDSEQEMIPVTDAEEIQHMS